MGVSPWHRLRLHYRHRCLLFAVAKGRRVRLALWSGDSPRPGYVHMNGRSAAPAAEIPGDPRRGIPLPAGVADEVVAFNLTEKVDRAELPAVFRDIHRVLRPGGRLLLAPPNPGDIEPLLAEAGYASVASVKGLARPRPGAVVLEAVASDTPRGTGVRTRWPAATWAAGQVFALRAGLDQAIAGLRRGRAWMSFSLFKVLSPAARAVARGAPPPAAPGSMLVFNMGGIGDFARMAPFLKTVRKKFPGARLAVVHNERISDIGLWRDYFDEAFALKPTRDFHERFSTRRVTEYKVYRLRPDLVPALERRRFDLGWVFGFNQATGNLGALLMDLAGVRYRIGVHLGNFEERFDVVMRPDEAAPNVFDFYALGLTPFGESVSGNDMAIRIDDGAVTWAREYLGARGLGPRDAVVVVHPGTAGMVASRCWPGERFAALADRIAGSTGAPVVLTGSSDQADLVRGVADLMKSEPIVVAGATTLERFCALLSLADLVVAGDTSALHLGLASGAGNVLGIFGPTHWRRVLPDSGRCMAVQSDLECSPCARLDGNDPETGCTRPIREECLLRISPEDVWARAREALAGRGEPREGPPR